MRRTAPVALLLVLHALVVLFGLAFQFAVRLDLLARVREVPPVASLALADATIPVVLAVGLSVTFAGVVFARGNRRLRLVATGLALSGLGTCGAVLAAFASLLLG